MTERMKTILAEGRVAVITGAAKGIGAAIATELSQRGLKLALIDVDKTALNRLASDLPGECLTFVGDVADITNLTRFRDLAFTRFGEVALLINNAGLGERAGPFDAPTAWQRILDVNFTATLAAQYLFLPQMIANGATGAVINLGSKEGITTPPGNAAYSVAKAGIKVLTEQLAHELRSMPHGRLSAHLLVPGYTWTPMNFPGMDPATDNKPAEPWTAKELVDYFLERLINDDFYIICPDNAVTHAIDAKRIQWAAQDMIDNRPALSRWHPDWKGRFADWVAN